MRQLVFLLILTTAFNDPAQDGAEKSWQAYEKVSDKERIYNVGYDKLWNICKTIATDSYTVTLINKDEGLINFESGQKFTSNPFRYGISLSKVSDEKTKIVLNVQNKGYGGLLSSGQRNKRTKELFTLLDKKLTESHSEN